MAGSWPVIWFDTVPTRWIWVIFAIFFLAKWQFIWYSEFFDFWFESELTYCNACAPDIRNNSFLSITIRGNISNCLHMPRREWASFNTYCWWQRRHHADLIIAGSTNWIISRVSLERLCAYDIRRRAKSLQKPVQCCEFWISAVLHKCGTRSRRSWTWRSYFC